MTDARFFVLMVHTVFRLVLEERHSRSECRSRSLFGVRHLLDIAGVSSPIFAE